MKVLNFFVNLLFTKNHLIMFYSHVLLPCFTPNFFKSKLILLLSFVFLSLISCENSESEFYNLSIDTNLEQEIKTSTSSDSTFVFIIQNTNFINSLDSQIKVFDLIHDPMLNMTNLEISQYLEDLDSVLTDSNVAAMKILIGYEGDLNSLLSYIDSQHQEFMNDYYDEYGYYPSSNSLADASLYLISGSLGDGGESYQSSGEDERWWCTAALGQCYSAAEDSYWVARALSYASGSFMGVSSLVAINVYIADIRACNADYDLCMES